MTSTGSPAQLAEIRSAVARFAREAGSTGSAGGVRLTIADYSNEARKGIDRVFVGLGATIDAFPEILLAALPAIRAAHRDVFDTEGAAGRGRWAALRPATLADRARRGYPPGPILQRSGALMRHVLTAPPEVTRTGDVVELRIAPDPVVAGTGRPYFRAQSLGSSATNLPPRPMVAIGPRGAVSITSAVSRALRARAMAEGL